ncbi:histidinol-phosphate transaminase [Paradesulfitobacterium aromaticivorans]
MDVNKVLVNPADFARADVLSLEPLGGKVFDEVVKMDANENPFPWPQGMREELEGSMIHFNRYPDPNACELKDAIAGYTGVSAAEILVGNGSDELIHMVLSTFGGEGRAVVLHPPTFGMYQAAAKVSGTKDLPVPLVNGLNLDVERILARAQAPEVSVIILCSPNNPTGTLFARADLLRIVESSGKIVVMDEAYAEFCGQSLVDEIQTCPNLLVMRTFSKAFGLAGLRLGYLLGQAKIINLINRVRQPYNVNSFSQKAGVLALKYLDQYLEQIEVIKRETEKIFQALTEIPSFKVYPTKSNFILFQPDDADAWHHELLERGFLVRHMGDLPLLGKSLRVSAGLPEENDALIKAVWEIAMARKLVKLQAVR